MKDLQRFEQLKNTMQLHANKSGLGIEYECYEYDDYLKLIEAKFDDSIKYIGVDDYQRSDFRVGYVGTVKDWVESALSWCDSDEMYETIHCIVMYCDDESALIEIQDIWQIKIEKYDENNAEHRQLKEDYERW